MSGNAEKVNYEKLMSCSTWNPLKSSSTVLREFYDVSEKLTKRARGTLECTLNVPYDSQESNKYDIYGDDLPSDSNVFFWIHGGYWQEGSKDTAAVMATLLHQNGVRTIVVGYSLCPMASIGLIQEEIKSALKKALKQFPRARFIIGGHSAGAQLAAQAAIHSCGREIEFCRSDGSFQLIGLYLVSGIYDLKPLLHTSLNRALDLDMDSAVDFSPMSNITENLHINSKVQPNARRVRVIVSSAQYDSPEFQKQALAYAEALELNGFNVSSPVMKHEDHFSIVQNLSQANTSTAQQMLSIAKR